MIARFFALGIVLLAATTAQAQVAWNAPATGCAPTAETIGKYRSSGTVGVQHAGNRTGTLVFICPVDRLDSAATAWVLRMAYRDSTGTANTASVIARLYRVAKGAFAPVLIGTLSSNSFAATTNNAATSVASFSHTFDFDANAYFVRVTLTRTASTQVVRLYSAGLEEK